MIDLIKEYSHMSDAEKAVYWVTKYYESSKHSESEKLVSYRHSGKTRRSFEYKAYESAIKERNTLRRLRNKIMMELDHN